MKMQKNPQGSFWNTGIAFQFLFLLLFLFKFRHVWLTWLLYDTILIITAWSPWLYCKCSDRTVHRSQFAHHDHVKWFCSKRFLMSLSLCKMLLIWIASCKNKRFSEIIIFTLTPLLQLFTDWQLELTGAAEHCISQEGDNSWLISLSLSIYVYCFYRSYQFTTATQATSRQI